MRRHALACMGCPAESGIAQDLVVRLHIVPRVFGSGPKMEVHAEVFGHGFVLCLNLRQHGMLFERWRIFSMIATVALSKLFPNAAAWSGISQVTSRMGADEAGADKATLCLELSCLELSKAANRPESAQVSRPSRADNEWLRSL